MSRICRLTRVSLFLALFCAQIAGRYDLGQAEEATPRKIGVSLGLTGDIASVGSGIRNAILLADRENDPEGFVDFIFEDDGFDPKRTALVVKKFIDQDRVDGLIVLGSGTALAVNGMAEDAKVPLLALGNSNKIIENKKYVMMHFLNTNSSNEVIVQEVKQRGYQRIAVIASNHDAMLALSEAFRASLPDRVAYSSEVLTSDRDFRTEIAKIKASNANAVYNVLLPGSAGLFAAQLRKMGFKGDLFSSHAVEDWKEVENSQGALIGTWFVTGNIIEDAGFNDRYRTAYGESPKLATANGYDAAKLFIAAARTKDMNAFLHGLKDFRGVIGTYGMHPKGYFNLPAGLRMITPGGFVPLHQG